MAGHDAPPPPPSPGLLVLTGASGYLGEALCRGLVAAGWRVRTAQRSRGLEGERVEHVAYDLAGRVPARLFDGASVLVHNAWLMQCRSERQARRVNIEGSRRLLEAARAAGVGRRVFVSSCSAHDDAVSLYGRSKRAVEGLLDPERDLVVRPGLVIGPGGMALRLQNFVRLVGMVPQLWHGEAELAVQPVARRDVVAGLARALEAGLTGRLVLANPQPTPLSRLMLALAERDARPPLKLPVRASLLLRLFRLGEAMGLRLPLGSDNLLGLMAGVVQPSADDLARVGLRPRSLAELRRPEMG